jgi:GntR family transcriptional regulator/MocR family aminotransferase
VRCTPEQVLVISGSQQGLDLAARVLLDRGDRLWIEDPGYWGAQDAFRVSGAELVAVPVDESGLDVEAGIARAPEARAVFVTPSHQFPMGATLTAARRLRLLEWASRAGAWIVEDDYNGEYRYEGPPITALQGLDRDRRVLYLGTFSKVLSPGLRIGYLVLPDDLVDSFAAVRYTLDIAPPAFLQAVLADFLEEGHFARHLRRTRALYRERRAAVVAALIDSGTVAESGDGDRVRLVGAQAGLHLVVTLPERTDDRAVSERAARAGLRVMPLSACFVDPDARRPGPVLGYGGVHPREAAAAVSTLRRAIGSPSAADRHA